MPTAILRAVAEADTKFAEAKLAGFGKSIKSTAAIGTAAFIGLAAIVGKSIHSFMEHEKVVAQLENTIKNMPQLAGATTEAFEKQAAALQDVTGFQDELILSSDTVLARFGLTEDQIKRLTPLVLDFARATGKDATDSATAIGRALLGNARALKTVGINFKSTG